MEEMAGDRTIVFGDRLFAMGLEQFRRNISDLACGYRDANVPVFLATLVSNERDQPPLVSGLDSSTDIQDWDSRRERVDNELARGDTLAALRTAKAWIDLDTTSADASYRTAKILDMLGRHREARQHYLRAKDLDQLRFRAPEDINAIIRDVAQSCEANLVDVQAAFVAASPEGIVGKSLLLEHVHPNVEGYFLLSDTFYETLYNAGIGGDWPAIIPADRARLDVLHTQLDSTLGSWHVRRLLNNWPFQKQGVTRADTLRISTFVDSLALDVLTGDASWFDATVELGAGYEQRGDLSSALRAALALADEHPYLASPYLKAANLLLRQGRYSTAVEYYRAADDREASLEARRRAGGLLVRRGRFEEAVPWLRRALELDAADRSALFDLAVAYAALGRPDEARSRARELLNLNPEDPRARMLIQRIEEPAPRRE
jgi:tetratricopeptide (TPR) repeat protein